MIAALLLAAGRSRRMGAQKLLLPFGGKTVIAHIADEVLAGPVDRTFAVVGAGANKVAGALAGRPVEFIVNPDPEGDMLSSVRCGLRAMPSDCEAVLVALGDQPGITSGLIERMIQAYRAGGPNIGCACLDTRGVTVGHRPGEAWFAAKNAANHGTEANHGTNANPGTGGGIWVPAHQGRRGHPILFSASYRDEVLSRYDDVGLRGLLQAHPQDVREVPVPGELLLSDMDYPEDYRRELAKIRDATLFPPRR